MPFVCGRFGPSASPILLPRKGISALRHAYHAKIIGGSRLSEMGPFLPAQDVVGRLVWTISCGPSLVDHRGGLRPPDRSWPTSGEGRRAARMPRNRRTSPDVPTLAAWSGGLVLGSAQQPVLRRLDECVPAGVAATMQREDHPTVVAVVLLPPPGIRHRLLGVLVRQVVEVVVRHLDGETVVPRLLRQSTRKGPGTQDAVLLQTQVEVVARTLVLVQHESGTARSHSIASCSVVADAARALWSALP